MGLNASKVAGGGPRTPALEPGPYPARLVQVVDLGVQPRSYKGEEKTPMGMVRLTYELLDEFLLDDDGDEDPSKPRWLSEDFPLYNMDAEKAKSTQRIKVLDPTGKHSGDLAMMLTEPVILNVVQSPSKKKPGVVYNNVSGLIPMREKDKEKAPLTVNEPRVFDLDNPDMDVYKSLPEFVQKQICENLEFEGSVLAKALGAQPEAETPTEETSDDSPY